MDYIYKEIVIGKLNKGARVNSKLLNIDILEYPTDKCNEDKSDLYASYYNYSEDMVEYFNKYKSVSKYPGKIAIDKIYLDFDIPLEEFRDLLHTIPENYSQIYFSGTGFHVHLENIYGFQPSIGLHMIVKDTLIKDFPKADVIYDKTRIFRVANSINSKSGCYKTHLQREAIINAKDIHEIHDLCKIYPGRIQPQIIVVSQVPVLKTITDNSNLPINVVKHGNYEDNTKIATCVQTMYSQGPVLGTRHERILRMVSVFRRAGLPKDALIKVFEQWSGLKTMEVSNIVNSVYKTPLEYGCNDPVLASFCHYDCVYYKNKDLITVKTIRDLENDFLTFLNTELSSIINLRDFYPIERDYKFYPGELIAVIGDTGIGKTAFLQNICVINKMPTLYLSLEVSSQLLFRRFAQIQHRMSKEDLFNYYKNNKSGITQGLEHLKCQFVGPKLEMLEKIIVNAEPKVIVIDTLDGIHVPFVKDSLNSMERIAVTLKELAQKHNLIIFGVHHISKQASYGGQLTVHSGKGSSSLEQKADKLISIEGEKNMVSRTIRSLKARDESAFTLKLNYNFNTFTYDNP